MSDKITVIMYARVDKNPVGSIAEYENTPHVHRLIRSGKVGLVDPPSIEMIEGFENGKSSNLSKPANKVYERPVSAPPKGSGTSGSKRASGRNRTGSSGSVGENGSGPSSGPVEGLSDDRVYVGSGEESSESFLDG